MILAFRVSCNMTKLESQGTDVANHIGLILCCGSVGDALFLATAWSPLSNCSGLCPKWQTSQLVIVPT